MSEERKKIEFIYGHVVFVILVGLLMKISGRLLNVKIWKLRRNQGVIYAYTLFAYLHVLLVLSNI